MKVRATLDLATGAVEYAILLALIAVICVGGLAYLGSRASRGLGDSGSKIAGTSSTSSVITVAPTTTTTRPPGVPLDWPADKPIPPVPDNCRQPQLEDNGVWNCQH